MPIRRYGTMLFVSSLCLIAYNGMDLFMLKVLGGTAVQSGIYGAAQSLSLLPGFFAWTFSSLLLTTLSRLLADQAEERARELARDAMRVALWLLPVAAIISGAAPELVQVVFGSEFAGAAPLLSLLIIGAVANVMLVVSLTVMIATGLPARTVMSTAPLVPLAFVGHLMLIPRLGAQGAAFVTVGVSLLGASAAVASVYRLWRVSPPVRTLVRSLVVALVVGIGSALWTIPGLLVFGKLIALGMISLLVYWLMGEFPQSEMTGVRSILLRKTEATHVT
jgi:O-antigen/teichoic acid export membrane protein